MKVEIVVDTEYLSQINKPTIPICVTLNDRLNNKAFYTHPNAPKDVLDHANKFNDKIFKHDCVILDYLEDYYGFKVRNNVDNAKHKNYYKVEIIIFFSFKDIEFLFRYTEDYKNFVLPKLSRTRRINIQNIINTANGGFCSDSIGLPYIVSLPDKDNGRLRDYKISLKIVDISAMQGGNSLKNYASNVGIEMVDKNNYTPIEKERMDLRYIENRSKFVQYSIGDTNLIEIMDKTNDFYNKIAELIGVKKLPSFGMSLGKIVARLVNDWLCNQLNTDSDSLYKMQCLAGSEGINHISKIIKDKSLIYGSMVDGGRTVKERNIDILIGSLIDIDIDSCYGNGLKNQLYAIGIPSITSKDILLKDWLKIFEGELVPGLWVARISYNNNSKSKYQFKQDLLISKTKEAFTSWNWVIEGIDNNGFEMDDDGKKVYDASMCLTTKNIHYATLTHDLLQTLKKVSSNQEWSWLLNNAVINCSLIYKKSDEVLTPTDKMLEGVTLSKDTNTLLDCSKVWIRIDLKPLMTILITERKLHSKNTPMNKFLKDVINTVYGCIASEFFSIKNACISNVIVGNNITARARCLVWCMSKGLSSAMSITDGGVFEVNNVNKFKKISLNLLEGLHRDVLSDGKNRFCFKIPLMGFKIDFNNPKWSELMLDKLGVIPDKDIGKNIKTCLNIIDKKAWEHLTSIFDIDIFNDNQFSFETKEVYTKMIQHSKVDYYLEKADGGYKIAFRGMPKIYDPVTEVKIYNPIAIELFKAIEFDIPISKEVYVNEMLSLSDYKIQKNKDSNYPLLPHDLIRNKPKVFYSHTPNGCRVKSLSENNKIIKKRETAKNVKTSNNPIAVANVKILGDLLSDD